MSKFKSVTPKTLAEVMLRFSHWAIEDENHRVFCIWLNAALDDFLSQDAFGTEGQCDPRGDHRD